MVLKAFQERAPPRPQASPVAGDGEAMQNSHGSDAETEGRVASRAYGGAARVATRTTRTAVASRAYGRASVNVRR